MPKSTSLTGKGSGSSSEDARDEVLHVLSSL